MSTKPGELEQLISAIKDVQTISIGESKEVLPKEHLAFPLRNNGLFFGTQPGATPEQQFLLREKLNNCIEALEQHHVLEDKYVRLKKDYKNILESSEQEDFEAKQLKNLARFLGKTKQFGILDSSRPVLTCNLSEHTISIVQLQLQSKEEYTVRVSRGELYACQYENFTVIVERDTPLSNTEKNHIKLTLKYISLQRTQNSLKEAMTLLLEEENGSGQIAVNTIESSLQKCLDNLVKDATIDPLTMAFNRRYLLKHVESLYRKNQMFSIVITDIDHFKNINDTYGHEIGDQVLCEFVDILSDNIRNEDVIARWGGEEFLIVLQSVELETAVSRAEAMRQHIENHGFKTGCPLTASFGVVSRHLRSDDFKELVRMADEALYRAKDSGRNRVEFEQR